MRGLKKQGELSGCARALMPGHPPAIAPTPSHTEVRRSNHGLPSRKFSSPIPITHMRSFFLAVVLLALLHFAPTRRLQLHTQPKKGKQPVVQKKNKTVDVKVIDHKGINTVVTPKHVLDHNNVTEHASNECPKDEAGRVCSEQW